MSEMDADDLENQRERYARGESMTPLEIDRLRIATSSDTWAKLVEKRRRFYIREEDVPTISDIQRGIPDPGIRLFPTAKTDAQRAEELRCRMTIALGEIIAILDDALEDGIRIGFQLSQPNSIGKHHVCMLEILKEL